MRCQSWLEKIGLNEGLWNRIWRLNEWCVGGEESPTELEFAGIGSGRVNRAEGRMFQLWGKAPGKPQCWLVGGAGGEERGSKEAVQRWHPRLCAQDFLSHPVSHGIPGEELSSADGLCHGKTLQNNWTNGKERAFRFLFPHTRFHPLSRRWIGSPFCIPHRLERHSLRGKHIPWYLLRPS